MAKSVTTIRCRGSADDTTVVSSACLHCLHTRCATARCDAVSRANILNQSTLLREHSADKETFAALEVFPLDLLAPGDCALLIVDWEPKNILRPLFSLFGTWSARATMKDFTTKSMKMLSFI